LHELGEGWRLQPLQTPSSAPRLNLDYFSITIDQIPINPMTGLSWTPEELFSHIRKNINDFVDVNLSEFLPFSSFDQELWLSNNPVRSIISIDIQGPDNGSVICGQSENCCWIFSTIKAPMLPGFDGFHPVSGNRQFGYKLLSNGSLEIYTKGVDRFLFPTLPGGDPFAVRIDKLVGYLAEGVAFNGADNLWFSFMEGIKIFVEQPNYQGNANINSPIKHRPDVFQQFVEIFRSNNPITKVPCAN
jgi:hypothetical protein